MSRSVSLDDDDPISLDDEIIEKLTASTPPIYLRPKPSVRRNTTDDTRETPPVRRNTPVEFKLSCNLLSIKSYQNFTLIKN